MIQPACQDLNPNAFAYVNVRLVQEPFPYYLFLNIHIFFLCADGLIDQITVLTSTTSITLISYTNQITSTDQASIALTSDEKITMISQITVIARFITIVRERISLLAIILRKQ